MSVRAAGPGDVPVVVRLAGLMYQSMGLAPGRDWGEAAAQAMRAGLGSGRLAVFVAVDDDDVADVDSERPRVVASAAGTIATRLPSPGNTSARVGYVQWVATDPAYRRRGHARAVTEALLRWYDEQGVRSVELHATEAAEPLYRGLGFSDAGPVALRRRAVTAPG